MEVFHTGTCHRMPGDTYSFPLGLTLNHLKSCWIIKKNPQTTNAGEGRERREPSYTVGRNVNWYSHCVPGGANGKEPTC